MIGSVTSLLLSGLPLGYGAQRRRRNLVAAISIAFACVSPAMAAPVVIAALGDSLTQGYGLEQGDGLVPQLQSWLDAQGEEVTLVNAGVSGDTTAGGLARVEWTLTPEVRGMIVALGGNDLLRGIDPAEVRANLEGILTAADSHHVRVLLVAIAAPGNFGPDYKRDFDAIFPDLAAEHHSLLHPGFFTAILGEGGQSVPGDLMQADGIHPNARGVLRIVQSVGPSVRDLVAEIRAE